MSVCLTLQAHLQQAGPQHHSSPGALGPQDHLPVGTSPVISLRAALQCPSLCTLPVRTLVCVKLPRSVHARQLWVPSLGACWLHQPHLLFLARALMRVIHGFRVGGLWLRASYFYNN